MKGKPRIELNPAQAGLNPAFAALSLPGLPEGPADAPAVDPATPTADRADPAKPLPPNAGPPPKRGRVVLRRETAHRGGKAVLIVHDFAPHIPGNEIASLAKRVRAACGCGGTVHDREIELQGEHTPKVRALLESEGYQVAGVK